MAQIIASRIRQLLQWMLLCILIYGTLETVSYLAFWAATGTPFSFDRVQREQASLIRTSGIDNRSKNTMPHPLYADHGMLGYTYWKNADIYDVMEFKTDSKGFPLEIGAIDDKDFVIGVTGGSVALQIAIGGAERIRRAVSGMKAVDGRNVRIVPLAIGGYAEPQQAAITMYHYLNGGTLDVLLNINGFNEVTRYKAAGNPLDWKRGDRKSRDMATQGQIALMKQLQYHAARLATACRHSVTINTIWYFANRIMTNRVNSIRSQIYAPHATNNSLTQKRKKRSYPKPSYLEHMQVWARSARMLHDFVHSQGGVYMEFVQPNAYDTDSKPLSPEEADLIKQGFNGTPITDMKRTITQGYDLIRRMAGKLRQDGILVADITDIFSNHAETVYIDSCCHLNQQGIDMVTDRIIRDIGQQLERRPLQAPMPAAAP